MLGFTSANASDKKGIKVYKKLCQKCHGGPFRTSSMHTIDEWEDIQDSSEKPFVEFHKDDSEILAKFDNYLSEKRRKYLFEFLINNAKDSGIVPGCNGSYCGQN